MLDLDQTTVAAAFSRAHALDFEGHRWANEDAISFAPLLRLCDRLRWLSLKLCSLSDRGLEAFARAFENGAAQHLMKHDLLQSRGAADAAEFGHYRGYDERGRSADFGGGAGRRRGAAPLCAPVRQRRAHGAGGAADLRHRAPKLVDPCPPDPENSMAPTMGKSISAMPVTPRDAAYYCAAHSSSTLTSSSATGHASSELILHSCLPKI